MSTHDYIVIGAGSAGAVVAARLIEQTSATVLLLDAGGGADRDDVRRTDLPSMASLWQNPETVWPYETTPQPGLGGRIVRIPQGKMLGGGSSVNALLYVRGNRRDYDHWNSLGNYGWSFEDVLPYFVRAEDCQDNTDKYRGTGGPISVVKPSRPSDVSAAFLAAARELGFGGGVDFDYNGARQEGGAFFYQSTRTKDDQRASTAYGYLEPLAGHERLTVDTGAVVHRVLLDGATAVGVEYERHGTVRRAGAGSEVILAAGALGTPTLLMRSGIGPAGQLRARDIGPVLDLPGVGQNLRDHLILGVAYATPVRLPAPELLAEAGLFVASRDELGAAGHEQPDLQFFFGPVQFVDDSYRVDGPAFTFAPVLVKPRSTGTVTLRSSSPADLPVVDPHYLESAADLEVLVRGIEVARELAHTSAFAPFSCRETAPGGNGGRADLAEYVRKVATTVWHPVGTCRMGVDRMAVVDPELRVYGVDRLRVADASVMPDIPAGNTNAATIMIGERAADLISGRSRQGDVRG